MTFSSRPPFVMHVDINSCFATIEQQANPTLRNKPIVVAAYTTGNGCILAASVEAKRLGMRTGMRVSDGKRICPSLVVLPSDPEKYRAVNHQLVSLLETYTDTVRVESIDEMVLSLEQTPALWRRQHLSVLSAMQDIGREIKVRIRKEIGEWITVSIGIAPNRYLAKVASGLEKPDGLRWIIKENIESVFDALRLEDLCGIKSGNAARLRLSGIGTPKAMLAAESGDLVRAFHSVVGYYWWRRIHGWEDGSMYKSFDQPDDEQKSFGQSYAFPQAYSAHDPRLWQILSQLVMKMGRRLRHASCTASGVGVSLFCADHSHWHTQQLTDEALFADRDFYDRIRSMLGKAPKTPVRILAISCYRLMHETTQLSLLEEDDKKRQITHAIDTLQDRFGDFTVTPGRMLSMERRVLDRIAFGKTAT